MYLSTTVIEVSIVWLQTQRLIKILQGLYKLPCIPENTAAAGIWCRQTRIESYCLRTSTERAVKLFSTHMLHSAFDKLVGSLRFRLAWQFTLVLLRKPAKWIRASGHDK